MIKSSDFDQKYNIFLISLLFSQGQIQDSSHAEPTTHDPRLLPREQLQRVLVAGQHAVTAQWISKGTYMFCLYSISFGLPMIPI